MALMDETVLLFTLFYLTFSFCFVFRTIEFISAGLSIEGIFSTFLGNKQDDFIFYHIRRSSCTLLVHSCLVLCYQLVLTCLFDYTMFDGSFSILNIMAFLSLALPLATTVTVYRWSKNNWENHPISRKLFLFRNNINSSWRTLSSDINTEYRRAGTLTIKSNSLVDVVLTDNWLIKVSPYSLDIAHQSDLRMVVKRADKHPLGIFGNGAVQFLNIQVLFTRGGNHQFYLRLNIVDFKDLEQKSTRPVFNPQNIVFHRTRADRFLDVFKEQVGQNPLYPLLAKDIETCFGCMVNPTNVKLVKSCADESGTNPCRKCYCRPLWCVVCLGLWFASRQEDKPSEDWLSSKCTCPVCRHVFCILDVSPIIEIRNERRQ